ncbi:MAG TPA: DUF1329 domain-containing protein [Alphaproteobacteria bacterium]|nr:DUF1329 domain-containing protein [Alphaproteobacteria bacterium]
MKRVLAAFAVSVSILSAHASVFAAVSAEEAARLKGPLTPVGAERAGNADGTIPAWAGGYTTAPAGYVQGQRRDDPFAGEKPLFSITSANYRSYSAKLTEGQKALFAKFPDYRMDIYPTHRTAAAPQRVYDAVAANAERAQAGPDGIAYGVTGAAGGVPFPIPKNGAEVIWNHLLAFWGPAREDEVENYLVSSDGSRTLTNHYKEIVDFPYYYPDASPGSFGDYYFKRREISLGPPGFAGRGYLLWQPNNVSHQAVPAWQYVPREGRVRKSPLLSYDTPTPDGGGIESFDDYYVFSGSPDRYDFTLIGKREMYIPYNNNRFHGLPIATVAGPRHLNPDTLRYELHRVWVVDATLAAGKHHLAPHRRFYVDEDTWFAVYCDAWDADGRLWKFSHGTMYLVSDLPAVVLGSEAIYDVQDGGYVFAFAFNDVPRQFVQTPPHSPTAFSPETLAAEASH